MSINRYEEMNEMELDIIKEIGSIGNGNAATALSSLLSAEVKMPLPKVDILEFNEALGHLGNPEDVVAAILVEMSGEIQGIMLFILSKEFSDEIIFRVTGQPEVDFLDMKEIETSVLTEIGNIMISSYINALSSLTNVNVILSVPQMAVNMLGGILSLPMAMLGLNSDRIMMITGKFKIEGRELDSDMLLLPDVESLNVLMRKLGVV